MMTPVQRWITAVAFDGLMFALLYLGTVQGIEGARTVFETVLWIVLPLVIFGAFLGDPPTDARSNAYVAWNWASDAAMIVWMALAGMAALAVTALIARIAVEASRMRGPA